MAAGPGLGAVFVAGAMPSSSLMAIASAVAIELAVAVAAVAVKLAAAMEFGQVELVIVRII